MERTSASIWMGSFESKEQFNAFMEERYSEDDDTPLSDFAASQNQTWYDHDWLEYYYTDEGLDELISNIPNEYRSILKTKFHDSGIPNSNAIIAFYDDWSSTVEKVEQPPLCTSTHIRRRHRQ